VRAHGHDVPEDVVLVAAGVAAHFSRSRQDARVAVDVTLQRHVRRIKGAPPGMVTYSAERTVHVSPALPSPLTTAGSRHSSEKPSRTR
jgi:predicted ribosome quality control (RQC) complex YloA/Tae2 family protein